MTSAVPLRWPLMALASTSLSTQINSLAHLTVMLITAPANCSGIQLILEGLAILKEKAVNIFSHHQTNLLIVHVMLTVFIGIKWLRNTLTSGMRISMPIWVSFYNNQMSFNCMSLLKLDRHILFQSLPGCFGWCQSPWSWTFEGPGGVGTYTSGFSAVPGSWKKISQNSQGTIYYGLSKK